jgi:hypothetical protein
MCPCGLCLLPNAHAQMFIRLLETPCKTCNIGCPEKNAIATIYAPDFYTIYY